MALMNGLTYPGRVGRWSVLELAVNGPSDENPFVEQTLSATFTGPGETVTAQGFYDGEGVYRVRFMPSFEGAYRFTVTGSFMEPMDGSFTVDAPEPGNHGVVRVANTWHFAYDDGTPYNSVGTTCYVWAWQGDETVRQTLETLKGSGFNKIRFCVFPKHYDYNLKEPRSYPYEGAPMDSSVLTAENFYRYNGKANGSRWDFSRFNPAHFRHLDWCIAQLAALGIEADLILMHPYDRWGFSCMDREADERYIRYVVARYAAYHNVWWSLANEYDLMPAKSLADWEHIAETICECDPYRHLRSIHNCAHFYDHNRPWVTHCSIQHQMTDNVAGWRSQYRKPVVMDEICYEGNVQFGWGNISGQELVRRFWVAAARGGYAGHGETYLNHDDILWWSHGGRLHGESHPRLAFLRNIMDETPGVGLCPNPDASWDDISAVPEELAHRGDYYLFYYGLMRPSFRDFRFSDEHRYEVRVLNTWEMTSTLIGTFSGVFRIPLPGKEYMAIQIKRVKE